MNIKNEEAKRNRNRERIYLFVAESILICGFLCSDGKFDKRMEKEALDFVLSQESWQNEEHGNTSGASCSLFLRFAHGDMFLFGVLHFILFIFSLLQLNVTLQKPQVELSIKHQMISIYHKRCYIGKFWLVYWYVWSVDMCCKPFGRYVLIPSHEPRIPL